MLERDQEMKGHSGNCQLRRLLSVAPLEPVRDVLVAPVVVEDRVSLPTMRVAVSDACEFSSSFVPR